ncbi:uncharacterized transmembrane protein DDB_G0289901-like [Cherax quadricarinatus]
MPEGSSSNCHLCHIHDHVPGSSLLRTHPLRVSHTRSRNHSRSSSSGEGHPHHSHHSRDHSHRSRDPSRHSRDHSRHSRDHSRHSRDGSSREIRDMEAKQAKAASTLAKLSERSHSLPGSRSSTLSRPNEVSVLPDGDAHHHHHHHQHRDRRGSTGSRADYNGVLAALLETRAASLPRNHSVNVHREPDLLTALPRTHNNSRSSTLSRTRDPHGSNLTLAQDTEQDYYMHVHRARYKDEARKQRFNLQTVMLIGCYTLLFVVAIIVGVVLCQQNGWLGFGSSRAEEATGEANSPTRNTNNLSLGRDQDRATRGRGFNSRGNRPGPTIDYDYSDDGTSSNGNTVGAFPGAGVPLPGLPQGGRDPLRTVNFVPLDESNPGGNGMPRRPSIGQGGSPGPGQRANNGVGGGRTGSNVQGNNINSFSNSAPGVDNGIGGGRIESPLPGGGNNVNSFSNSASGADNGIGAGAGRPFPGNNVNPFHNAGSGVDDLNSVRSGKSLDSSRDPSNTVSGGSRDPTGRIVGEGHSNSMNPFIPLGANNAPNNFNTGSIPIANDPRTSGSKNFPNSQGGFSNDGFSNSPPNTAINNQRNINSGSSVDFSNGGSRMTSGGVAPGELEAESVPSTVVGGSRSRERLMNVFGRTVNTPGDSFNGMTSTSNAANDNFNPGVAGSQDTPAGNFNTGTDSRVNSPAGNFNTGTDSRVNSPAGNFNTGTDSRGNSPAGNFNTGTDSRVNSPAGNFNTGTDSRGNSPAGNFNTGTNSRGNSPAGNFNTGTDSRGNSPAGNFNTGSDSRGNSPAGNFNSGLGTQANSPVNVASIPGAATSTNWPGTVNSGGAGPGSGGERMAAIANGNPNSPTTVSVSNIPNENLNPGTVRGHSTPGRNLGSGITGIRNIAGGNFNAEIDSKGNISGRNFNSGTGSNVQGGNFNSGGNIPNMNLNFGNSGSNTPGGNFNSGDGNTGGNTPSMNFNSGNNGGNIPGGNFNTETNHGGNTPGINSGNTEGNIPGMNSGNIGGNIPGINSGNIGGNIPGINSGNIGGNIPGMNVGNIPGMNSGNIPGMNSGNIGGNIPGMNSGNIPGMNSGNTGGNILGMNSGNIGGNIPGMNSGDGGNIPGMKSGNTPGMNSGNIEGNTPGMNSGNIGGNTPGMTSRNNGGNTPGMNSRNNGGNTPGMNSGTTGGNTPVMNSGNIGGNTPGMNSGTTGGNTPGMNSGTTGGNTPGMNSGNIGRNTPGMNSGNTGGNTPGMNLNSGDRVSVPDRTFIAVTSNGRIRPEGSVQGATGSSGSSSVNDNAGLGSSLNPTAEILNAGQGSSTSSGAPVDADKSGAAVAVGSLDTSGKDKVNWDSSAVGGTHTSNWNNTPKQLENPPVVTSPRATQNGRNGVRSLGNGNQRIRQNGGRQNGARQNGARQNGVRQNGIRQNGMRQGNINGQIVGPITPGNQGNLPADTSSSIIRSLGSGVRSRDSRQPSLRSLSVATGGRNANTQTIGAKTPEGTSAGGASGVNIQDKVGHNWDETTAGGKHLGSRVGIDLPLINSGGLNSAGQNSFDVTVQMLGSTGTVMPRPAVSRTGTVLPAGGDFQNTVTPHTPLSESERGITIIPPSGDQVTPLQVMRGFSVQRGEVVSLSTIKSDDKEIAILRPDPDVIFHITPSAPDAGVALIRHPSQKPPEALAPKHSSQKPPETLTTGHRSRATPEALTSGTRTRADSEASTPGHRSRSGSRNRDSLRATSLRRQRGRDSKVLRRWEHMDGEGTLSRGLVRSDGSFAFTNCRPPEVCGLDDG